MKSNIESNDEFFRFIKVIDFFWMKVIEFSLNQTKNKSFKSSLKILKIHCQENVSSDKLRSMSSLFVYFKTLVLTQSLNINTLQRLRIQKS